tara:strand:+ start:217 stop:498 length:282 start_codon:yes stop_codon:yes gene_type:complete
VVVMTCELDLYLPDSRSLKDKRGVLKSLKERIHNRFSVSVAEVEQNDLWQRAVLGIAVVSSAADHANEILSKTVNFVEQDLRVQLLDYSIEPR